MLLEARGWRVKDLTQALRSKGHGKAILHALVLVFDATIMGSEALITTPSRIALPPPKNRSEAAIGAEAVDQIRVRAVSRQACDSICGYSGVEVPHKGCSSLSEI